MKKKLEYQLKIVCRCGNRKFFLSFCEKKDAKYFVIGFINKQTFFERELFILRLFFRGKTNGMFT